MSSTAPLSQDAAAPASQDPSAERRRSVRQPHLARAWIASPTATRPEERIEVAAMNLSRHGVGFELGRAVPQDTFYIIEIALGEQSVHSEIRIVSCRKSDHGTWEVGAEFC